MSSRIRLAQVGRRNRFRVDVDAHFRQSTFREKLIEHLFISELLKYSWLHRGCRLEIGRPKVDNSGYDIVAKEQHIIRHIQLKAMRTGGNAKSQ